MKDLTVRYWPTSKLLPYARNARLHSDEQVAQIAASIAEFGFVNPVLVDEAGEIVAGHGRALAAKSLGLKRVPVLVLGHLTPEQARAYRLADNRLAELGGGWNNELVKAELGDLSALGFSLNLTGFDLADFAGGAGKVDPDQVPEPAKTSTTERGTLFLLGEHRLVCGDATVAEDVAAALHDRRPRLMVTDPPYGVNYDPDWRNRAARTSKGMGNRAIGAGAVGQVTNDDRADWQEAWALFPGDVAYVWHGGLHAGEVAESLVAAGLLIRSQIVWDKTRMIIGRGDYHWEHEPCWYAVRKGKTGRWAGDRKQTTVWRIGHQRSETGHGTQKPVECMARPMRNNSKKGEYVYDPFLGSGTSIIAAEMEGRRCLGLEIDPVYCDVIVKRWETFTGQTATRIEPGKEKRPAVPRRARAARLAV